MRKTLRNIIAGSLIAGGLLFSGCQDKNPLQKTINSIVDQATEEQGSYDKALKFTMNPSSVLTGDVVKEESESIEETKSKNLEDYLFKDDELKFIELAQENVSPYTKFERTGGYIKGIIPDEIYKLETSKFNSNPAIIKENELNEGKIKDFFNEYKIEEFEWAQYDIPKREPSSRKQNLNLFLFRFESKEEAEKFLNISEDCRSAPIFLKENLMSIIYDPTFNYVYGINFLSEEQRKIYTNLIFDYIKRTDMKLVSLSEDSEENEKRLNFLNALKKDYSSE